MRKVVKFPKRCQEFDKQYPGIPQPTTSNSYTLGDMVIGSVLSVRAVAFTESQIILQDNIFTYLQTVRNNYKGI